MRPPLGSKLAGERLPRPAAVLSPPPVPLKGEPHPGRAQAHCPSHPVLAVIPCFLYMNIKKMRGLRCFPLRSACWLRPHLRRSMSARCAAIYFLINNGGTPWGLLLCPPGGGRLGWCPGRSAPELKPAPGTVAGTVRIGAWSLLHFP